jgi:hypothetical protein
MQTFNVSNMPIGPIQMDLTVALCIIAQIQLATRHRKNTGPSRVIAERFARELQRMVIEIAPENATVLDMGWNHDLDIDEQ